MQSNENFLFDCILMTCLDSAFVEAVRQGVEDSSIETGRKIPSYRYVNAGDTQCLWSPSRNRGLEGLIWKLYGRFLDFSSGICYGSSIDDGSILSSNSKMTFLIKYLIILR